MSQSAERSPGRNISNCQLKLAVFSVLPWGFELVRDWAQEAGHEVALLVTKPGPVHNPAAGSQVASLAEPGTVVIITPQVTDVCAALEELKIDLGVVFAYSRIPKSVAARPIHGIANLHPTLLPDYRGPNPHRALYEGQTRIGATLHWIVEDLDAGPILAQAACDVPSVIDPETVRAVWRPTLLSVLTEGVPKAGADDPGLPQPRANDEASQAVHRS